MAFSNGLSERMGELRFPNPRSPIDEVPFSAYTSPTRGQTALFSPLHSSSTESRGSLQRRFTTDSTKSSSLQNPPPQDPQMMKSHVATSFDKKRQQIEQVREQKRKFEAQMKLLDLQEQRLQQSTNPVDLDPLTNGFTRVSLGPGPVSEPTTPPDYTDPGFPTSLSRPSGFSITSMASPPGFNNRFSHSSSQLTSSPSGLMNNPASTPKSPAKSTPASRRNSEHESQFPDEMSPYRPPLPSTRYSMPAAAATQPPPPQRSSVPTHSGLGPLNTTSFLFDENDDGQLSASRHVDLTSPQTGSFLHMTPNDDDFPILRSDRTSGILSANPAALDLAKSRSPEPESWAAAARPRPNHQSMPQAGLNMFRPVINSTADEHTLDMAISQARLSTQRPQRHSAGVAFGEVGDAGRYDPALAGSASSSASRPLSLQSSYSTNDLPTVKNVAGAVPNAVASNTYAEQQLQNHHASLRRIPQNGTTNRLSRDLPPVPGSADSKKDEKGSAAPSAFQPSAAPFASQASSSVGDANVLSTTALPYGAGGQAPAYGYGMQSYNLSCAPGPHQFAQPHAAPGPYPIYGGYGRLQDNQTRLNPPRRQQGGPDAARYDNIPLENYRGRLYDLCKDQHGCRYLQKRLEEKNAEHTNLIFVEVLPFVIELMTDPFGNYLCQKLLEYSDNTQRTELIRQSAPAMVSIALNQHGTRALQKMVEYISTPDQIEIMVSALKDRVVELVQDLNGNHVIQKCLNKLGPDNSHFIFDAVGRHCVVVGTHRHGCCVLQRCIDHAKGSERSQLIAAITSNAFSLVQDPFGNYVVQYILDLDEPTFTMPLCRNFAGNIPALSKQKFSSNVIEKCLRTADVDSKRSMVDEMLQANELGKMLKDSFANYVVQTAIDHADPETRTRMIDAIRPMLPAIKQTPHGRRIAGKIMSADGQGRSGNPAGGQHAAPGSMGAGPFPRGKTNSNEAVGRRQFQIYGQHGLFQGNSSISHLVNPGLPEGLHPEFAGTNSFPMLDNGMATMFGDSMRPANPSVPAYSNRMEPGPGYI